MTAALLAGWLGLSHAAVAAPQRAESDHKVTILPAVRLGIGVAGEVSPMPASHLAFEFMAGPLIGKDSWGEGFWLLPEVGYAHRRNPTTSDLNLGLLGLGVGYGDLLTAFGLYTPRLVVGQVGNDLVLGFRHGISGHFLFSLIWIELSHQVLAAPQPLTHEILFTIGANPAPAIAFFAGRRIGYSQHRPKDARPRDALARRMQWPRAIAADAASGSASY